MLVVLSVSFTLRADFLSLFPADFRVNFILSCSAAARTTPGLPAANPVFSARNWRTAGLRYEHDE